MKNPHRQVGLRHADVRLIANLPDQPKLRTGNHLTLKDDDRKWDIEWVSPHIVEYYRLNRGWNNNI